MAPPSSKKKQPAKTSAKDVKAQPQVASIIKKKAKKKTVKKREPKPPGRKEWVPDLGKIENWASQGMLDNEMAALSGICHEVFSRKKNQLNHPELKNAIELGKAKGIAACSQKLLSLALSGSERSLHFYMERIGGRKAAPAGSITIETGEDGKKTKVTISDLYKDLREAE